MYCCSKDCLILIPFRLPHISCFTLSLKWFSSDSDNCPAGGSDPCLASPPAKGRSTPTNTPVFLPSSFVLQFCMVLYILSHWSGTPVHPQLAFWMHFYVEGLFLMYPWKCTPHPPTPLPSCFLHSASFLCAMLMARNTHFVKLPWINFTSRWNIINSNLFLR